MTGFRFRTRATGSANWVSGESQITSRENLKKIKEVVDTRGSIIVEHWYYYGGRAPGRFIFDDLEEFTDYLVENAAAGDSIHIWSMHDLCHNDNQITYGKCPNEEGLTPDGGAY